MENEDRPESEDRQEDVAGEPAVVWEPIQPASANASYCLQGAGRHFAKRLGRLLAQCGIIASEWTALRTLYGPQWRSPMELGHMIGMSKGGASKLVTRLVKKGLIEKRKSEFDRRFRSIGLTPHGRDFVARLAAEEKTADREFFRPLGNNRKFRLSAWMTRVLDGRHLHRMDEWMTTRMEQHGITRVDPDAGAKAAAEKQAKADALWDFFIRLGEAAASGKPLPPTPAL